MIVHEEIGSCWGLRAHVGGYIPLRLRDHEVEGELNIFVLSQTEILLFLYLNGIIYFWNS